jgi:hypothetical protein
MIGTTNLYERMAKGDPLREIELRATGARWGQRAIAVCAVTAFVYVAFHVVFTRPAPPIDQFAVTDEQTAVEEFACRFVATFLELTPATKDLLTPFWDGDINPPAVPMTVRSTQPFSILPAQSLPHVRVWSVIVDTAVANQVDSTQSTHLMVQAAIAVNSDYTMRAVSRPAVRPAREPGVAPQISVTVQAGADTPVFATVSGFLSALLVGQGSLDRYVAAGSTLTPITPPPMINVAVDKLVVPDPSVAADTVPTHPMTARVVATATVDTAAGNRLELDYPLVLSVSAGRWQVDRIDDAPPVDDIAPTDKKPTTSAPSTTTPVGGP